MRTTVSLDPDVARLLEQRMRDRGEGFKAALNAVLRQGFDAGVREAPAHYELPVFDSPFAPGIDADKINQLLDEQSPGESA
jgi:hypothetical protein